LATSDSAQRERDEDYDESWLDLVAGGNKGPPSTSSDANLEYTHQLSQSAKANSTTAIDSTLGDPSQIVSTVTATERSTLSDGSIQTKVVLKKRFADGKEESSETVHVLNHAQQQQQVTRNGTKSSPQPELEAAESGEADLVHKGKKSGGWFWKN
jgi:hypothetical protein